MTLDFARRPSSGGAVHTRLTLGMNLTDTTTSIEDSTGWPTTNFAMIIDAGLSTEEKVIVGSRSGLNLSGIVRNQDGSSAQTHTAGGAKLCWPAIFFQDIDEANQLCAQLTNKGDLLVKSATATQVPQRLPVGTLNQMGLVVDSAQSLGMKWSTLGLLPSYASAVARNGALPSPTSGQGAYVDAGDTTEGIYFYNGSSWQQPWNMPWGELGYAEATGAQTGISAIADITSATVTFTALGNRKIHIVGVASFQQKTAGGIVNLALTDGANTILDQKGASYATSDFGVLVVQKRITPAAGSTTYKLRISTNSNTVDMNQGATAPTTITVVDVGPSGAPL